MSGRIGGLSEEVIRLLGTVRSNHSELESHINASKVFVQATTEHQVQPSSLKIITCYEMLRSP